MARKAFIHRQRDSAGTMTVFLNLARLVLMSKLVDPLLERRREREPSTLLICTIKATVAIRSLPLSGVLPPHFSICNGALPVSSPRGFSLPSCLCWTACL